MELHCHQEPFMLILEMYHPLTQQERTCVEQTRSTKQSFDLEASGGKIEK